MEDLTPAVAIAGIKLSGGRLDRGREILSHQLRGEHDAGIVLRRVLDLLEIVQAGILVDAVGARDQPRRPLAVRIEVLVDGAGWNVDDVARLPFAALDLGLRLPAIAVGDLDVAV